MAFQGDSIYWVEVEKVVPNPFQPRREFDQSKLQELADSIRMYGVLQPLTVTRKEVQNEEDGTFYTEYELIAGERRMRASKLAGVAQVPVIIREGEQSEQEKLELAIIENLQREDLNAVDRALAFKQLADTFGLSHAQVAQKVGRSREYVSNSIRLLGLPEHMLHSLKLGDMMEGHARTLLMLTDRPEEQEVVYKEILLKKLSVREVERIVRKIATDKVRKKNPGEFDANLIEFEKKFTETLGTRVQIQKTDFGGKLTIDYFSEDDLQTILQRIKDEEADKIAPKQHEMVDQLAAATPLAVAATAAEPATPTQQLDESTSPIATTPADPEPAPGPFAQSEPAVSAPAPTPISVAEPDPSTAASVSTPAPAPEPKPEPTFATVAQTEHVPESEERPMPEDPSLTTPADSAEEDHEVVSSTETEMTRSEPSVPSFANITMPAPQEPPAVPTPQPETQDTQKKDDPEEVPMQSESSEREDDSGLYSIRNFTV